MGSGEGWGGGAHPTPLGQDAAWEGRVPRGGSLQAQLRHWEGPGSTLEAPCGAAAEGMGEPGGRGPREEPLYILHSVPLVLPASTGGQEVIVQQGGCPRDPSAGASRHTHTRVPTQTESRLSIRLAQGSSLGQEAPVVDSTPPAAW